MIGGPTTIIEETENSTIKLKHVWLGHSKYLVTPGVSCLLIGGTHSGQLYALEKIYLTGAGGSWAWLSSLTGVSF